MNLQQNPYLRAVSSLSVKSFMRFISNVIEWSSMTKHKRSKHRRNDKFHKKNPSPIESQEKSFSISNSSNNRNSDSKSNNDSDIKSDLKIDSSSNSQSHPISNDKNKTLLTGLIKRHSDGFGFLIPDNVEHADVYISKHSMIGIMTNDRVFVEVFKSRGQDRYHGEIIRVISRGTETVVGRLTRLNDHWFQILDESKGWGQDLRIKAEDILSAKVGDLVEVKILHYPQEGTPFSGHVIDVLGNAEDPLTDIKRVLRSQNIPDEFSPRTLAEVAPLNEDPSPEDWKKRRSLMDIPLITIDGATAKDFDDAVFTQITEEGFRLIVAIADVSHYVKPGTALDEDAYQRGTSVYFPNFVVPMLPEVLSNGLCSLKPHVPRLCMVADMRFDFQGQMVGSEFYEAVMKSHARVTYGEAQEIIEGTPIEKFRSVQDTILRCTDLAKVLMARRFREGSLDLNISQTVLEIDASGNPIDVQKSERLFAHRLIEELMLAANVAVAQFIESKELGGIYRIHEDPSPDAIKMLEVYLHNLGSKVSLSSGKLQKQLTKILEHFADHAEEQIINILTLRSLSQAKYSSNNIGHFGLGFQSYTHFTSPIRRYPDLIVHRLLKHFVVSSKIYPFPEVEDLTTAGNMLSASEQRAVKCERQFMSIKKARFLQKFVGQEFTGLVSSVARFGVFVLLREFDIDGLVKLENLGDDRWTFDEDNLRLVGDRSHQVYKLGQILKVKVLSVDVELGQINFDLDDEIKVKGGGRSRGAGQDSRQSSRGNANKDRQEDQRRGKAKGASKGNARTPDREMGRSSKSSSSVDNPFPSKGKKPSLKPPTFEKKSKEQKKKESYQAKKEDSFVKSSSTDKTVSKEPSKIPFYEKFKRSLDKKIEDREREQEKKKEQKKKAGQNQKGTPVDTSEETTSQKIFRVISRLKKADKETSHHEDHRNRKDSRKNSQKRGKTKNNSRRFR